MTEFRLYFRYLRMHFLAGLQYKGWPIQMLMVAVNVVTDPLDAVLMLERFGSVGDWTAPMILAQYGLALCCFGLAELFGRGLDYFPSLVRDGSFDRILLRPRSTLLQAVTLRFHLHRLMRVLGGGALTIYCLRGLRVAVGPTEALMLLLAVLAGALTYVSVFLIASGIAFFTIQPLDWIYIFTNGSYQVAKVPPTYLPSWLRGLFIFAVPMFPFCHFPLSAVCGWGAPYWQGFAALPAAALFFAVSWLLWRHGVRHYAGTGS